MVGEGVFLVCEEVVWFGVWGGRCVGKLYGLVVGEGVFLVCEEVVWFGV